MGDDPKRSALNAFYQMHEANNAFVLDGSAFTVYAALGEEVEDADVQAVDDKLYVALPGQVHDLYSGERSRTRSARSRPLMPGIARSTTATW